ncbi:MAG TPA: serine protease [Thermoanaerobaculia bacterium]|jgi:S1-C subfamily serine protease
MSELDGVPHQEVVIHPGRPALIVQNGDFGEPPADWAHLADDRETLKKVLPSVGRIERDGTFKIFGTGFMVADGVVMTNKHVVLNFAENNGSGWRFKDGVSVRIDFTAEHEIAGTNRFRIAQVLDVHPTDDLAMLRLEIPSGASQPPPLKLVARAPRVIENREVATIGFPTFDTGAGDLSIFQNTFNVKRLQPGRSTGLKPGGKILGHDCSTSGGNSGSCLIDPRTGHVLALHFDGRANGNLAVPMWELFKDNFKKKFDLHWAIPKQRAAHS